MLFLLSPAKALDYATPAGDVPHTQPLFVQQAAELIEQDIRHLFGCPYHAGMAIEAADVLAGADRQQLDRAGLDAGDDLAQVPFKVITPVGGGGCAVGPGANS